MMKGYWAQINVKTMTEQAAKMSSKKKWLNINDTFCDNNDQKKSL